MCGKEDKVGVNLESTQAIIIIILLCPYPLYTLVLFCPNVCRAPCALDPDPPSLCWRCGLVCHCSPESSEGLTAVRDHHNPVGSNRMWHLKTRPAWSRPLVPWRLTKCLWENKTASPLEEPPIPFHPIPPPFFLCKTTKGCSITLIYAAPSDLHCSRERGAGFPDGEERGDVWKAGCTPHPLGLCVFAVLVEHVVFAMLILQYSIP